jgi:hypothetical protein
MPRPRAFDWDEAARLYTELRNYSEVARRLGVAAQSVRYALQPQAREYNARYQRENKPHQGICPDCGGVASVGRWREGSTCWACKAKRQATSVRPDALRCSLCAQWLPDADFGPSRRRVERRGRHPECKPCQAARKRDWRSLRRATP